MKKKISEGTQCVCTLSHNYAYTEVAPGDDKGHSPSFVGEVHALSYPSWPRRQTVALAVFMILLSMKADSSIRVLQ